MSTAISSLNDRQVYVVDRTNYWINFYNNLLGISPKISGSFSNKMTHTAGTAEPDGEYWYLTFSNHFIHQSSYDQVIAHEVAHVFSDEFFKDNCHHDNRWAHIMRKSGYPAERCHNYKTPPRKRRASTITCTCKICGTRISIGLDVQTKIMEGQKYRCRICKTQIIF